MPHDPTDVDAPGAALDRFLGAARAQIGDRYRFGTEARADDADPTAFDSSELVEWAAHRAGLDAMPDGSWNQYRYLHEHGGAVSVDEALRTPGALVFGFSSDPLDSTERPARAYVGISLGNGRILDVSERAGEVREMDPGDFYGYGAKVPGLHAVDDPGAPATPVPDAARPDDLDPLDPGDPVDPGPGTVTIPGAYGPSHPDPEDLVCTPDDELAPEEQVCTPEDEPPPEQQVCTPDDPLGPTTLVEPAPSPAFDGDTYLEAELDVPAAPDATGDLTVDV
ncbi:MAG TPA: hypothetical protein VF743_05050 [Acidimicrobiales bacterium]